MPLKEIIRYYFMRLRMLDQLLGLWDLPRYIMLPPHLRPKSWKWFRDSEYDRMDAEYEAWKAHLAVLALDTFGPTFDEFMRSAEQNDHVEER